MSRTPPNHALKVPTPAPTSMSRRAESSSGRIPSRDAAVQIVLFLLLTAVVIVPAGCGDEKSAPSELADGIAKGPGGPALDLPAEPVRYGRDILPILSNRCFKCHGPDPATRDGKLRFDVREDVVLMREGRAAIVPGDPAQSQLVLRLRHPDPKKLMPPPASKMPALTDAEVDLLKRWIADGAKYEPHWAFVPPEKPPLPAVRDAAFAKSDADRFLLSAWERRGIRPSPPADDETWLRRVFLDLTGLPPTPEETAAFTMDREPNRRERIVDRLLQEEPYVSRYAERMASPWLDAARYADTIGLHTDAGRSVWPYRDRVLAALRDDQPYDRFATEQLAGDLLEGAGPAEKTASGFSRLHVQSDEGGAIDAEYLAEYAAERAATVGTVFLGLTIACARCHDHKYDPIGQADFYRLFAYFNSVEEPGVFSQLPDPKRAHEPFLAVPSPEQEASRKALASKRAEAVAARDRAGPDDDLRRANYETELRAAAGYGALAAELVDVVSAGGAEVVREADGSVFFGGKNPADDEQTFTFRLPEPGARLLSLEALQDPRNPAGGVGRAPNGNAVLVSISVETRRPDLPPDSRPSNIPLVWAAADVEQRNGDFAVVNALEGRGSGWAVDGHGKKGGRVALFVAARPITTVPNELVTVRLSYRSPYAQHTFGRVRLSFAKVGDEGLRRLPPVYSGWSQAGPFAPVPDAPLFERVYGPESPDGFDPKKAFGAVRWRYEAEFVDGRSHALNDGVHAIYLGRRIYVATDREIDAEIGSDDAVRAYLDGVQIHAHDIARGVNEAKDAVRFRARQGRANLVLKIVNTGGEGGFYYAAKESDEALTGSAWAVFLKDGARNGEFAARYAEDWRFRRSPEARKLAEEIASADRRLKELDAAIPRTMVMKERAESRPAYVLLRGQYDRPDLARGVRRGVPSALGDLPKDAPDDRRGLASWLVAPKNPLFARVAANRFWELLFGAGLVRTAEDFGLQGERPLHPELLDHLAVEFRDDDYSVKRFLRRIVLGATYAQSSKLRPELKEQDPDNRLLAFFPRRRLTAETLRDQALYVGGLLVETFGGPPVKPLQPSGLWEEVSMPASNTRRYAPGTGDDLRRRSLYTYWKRASPPPTLLVLDAPTRESCQVRRTATNTPLQALALWNDPDFVAAARGLALRTVAETPGPAEDADAARIVRLFRRAVGRPPETSEASALRDALDHFRGRYAADVEAATALASAATDAMTAPKTAAATPVSATEAGERAERAAWIMTASIVLNADATTSRN